MDLEHFVFIGRDDVGRTSLGPNARFCIVEGGTRGKTDGLVGKNIINTGVNLENEVRE